MIITQYISELKHWNKTHNLMSKNEIQNIDEHIDDSLSLYPLLGNYECIIDIGSGGGFPIIPLACLDKEKNVCRQLIATDIVDKKLAFLKWCAAKLDLQLDVIKIEKKTIFPQEQGVIISRAFSSIKNIIDWRDHHAPAISRFILLKGQSVHEELADAHIDKFELIKNPRGFIVDFTNFSSHKL